MTPSIRTSGGACLLKVAARPGASRSGVTGLHGDALKVGIAAQPEKGRANKELIAFLAKALGLRRAQVALHSGETSRDKTVRVEGMSEAELRARIGELLAG